MATVQQGREGRVPPIKVQIKLDECCVPMEVDTGASVSLMSEALYHKSWPGKSLSTSLIKLQTYSRDTITVLSTTEVQVSYQDQTATLLL